MHNYLGCREKIKVEIQREVREQIDKLGEEKTIWFRKLCKNDYEALGKFRKLELSMVDQEDWPPCMHKGLQN